MREYAAGAGETYVRAYAGGEINNKLKRMTAHSVFRERDILCILSLLEHKNKLEINKRTKE